MKKNVLRKIGVISLAVAVSMSMGVSAFAAEDAAGVTETNATSFNIDKEIMVYNDESIDVYGPGITFDYTVAPSDKGGKVTDSKNNSITVKKGAADSVTLSDAEAVFEKNAKAAAASEGKTIRDTITADVHLDKFSAAGVYRYEVKEAEPENFAAAGLTRPEGYDATRYLDVYIGNTAGGLQVTGYVLFADSIETGKTTGFVDAIGSGEGNTGYADKYYTYNYSITKVIDGTLADKTHAFPFSFATAGAVEGQKFSVSSTGSLQSGAEGGVAEIGTEVRDMLADGMTLTIKGLPANTTFNVTETNDSEDVYHVSIADSKKGDIIATADAVAVDAKTGTQAMAEKNQALTNYASAKNAAPAADFTATTFTNTLNDVSPTNVVTRYAPFLFIIAAAIILLVFMRRRRTQDDE